MANTLLTASQITKEALYLLQNELVLTKLLDNRSSDFNGKGIGYSLKIRRPINLQTVQAHDITSSIRDIIEESVTLTIDSAPISVPVSINDSDYALSMEEFSDRVLKPAMESMSSQVEYQVLSRLIPQVNNVVNSANFDFAATSSIRTRLNEKLCPQNDRRMLLTSGQSATLRADVKSLFITPKEAFEDGAIGTVSGMKLYESELLPLHTAGSRAATGATVTTTATEGATTIALTLPTSTTIKKGDTFTIGSIKNVNWYTKDAKTTLYQFTAAADVSAGTSVTVTLTEPIYGPGATGFRQRMSALPTASDAVTFVGAASTANIQQGLVFDKKFASIAFVELPVHSKVEEGATKSYKGISLRYQKDYTLGTNLNLARMDVQFGVALVQPEYACRFLSVA